MTKKRALALLMAIIIALCPLSMFAETEQSEMTEPVLTEEIAPEEQTIETDETPAPDEKNVQDAPTEAETPADESVVPQSEQAEEAPGQTPVEPDESGDEVPEQPEQTEDTPEVTDGEQTAENEEVPTEFTSGYGTIAAGTKVYSDAACETLLLTVSDSGYVYVLGKSQSKDKDIFRICFAAESIVFSGYVAAKSVTPASEAELDSITTLKSDFSFSGHKIFELSAVFAEIQDESSTFEENPEITPDEETSETDEIGDAEPDEPTEPAENPEETEKTAENPEATENPDGDAEPEVTKQQGEPSDPEMTEEVNPEPTDEPSDDPSDKVEDEPVEPTDEVEDEPAEPSEKVEDEPTGEQPAESDQEGTGESNPEITDETTDEEHNESDSELTDEQPDETESEITDELNPETTDEQPDEADPELTDETEAETAEENVDETGEEPEPMPYLVISGKTELRGGKSTSLTVTRMPDEKSITSVTWSSSDKTVATVSSAGKVTAKTVSEIKSVTISAVSKSDASLRADFVITVYPAATKVVAYVDGVAKNTAGIDFSLEGPYTLRLSAAVQPEGAAQSVTYKSSNSKVIKVDNSGLVTALKRGTATITITAGDGSGKYATVKVNAADLVHSISVTGSQTVLRGGKSTTLKAYAYPETAANRSVKWTSDSKYATVSSSGKVTAKTVPCNTEVHITATAKDYSDVQDTYTLMLYPAATSVSVYYDDAPISSLAVDFQYDGQTLLFDAKVLPEDADQGVTWSSSSAKIASIDPDTGIATLHKTGTVTLTAKATDGTGKKKSFKLYVRHFVTDLTLTGPEALAYKKSATIKSTAYPSNASLKTVTWSTADTEYISLSKSSGKVTAKKVTEPQLVTVTATATDGSNVTADYSFYVTPAATSVQVDWDGTPTSTVILDPVADPDAHLTASVLPAAAWQKVTWSTSDSKVVEVDQDGNIHVLKNGSATVKAKATDGTGKYAEITVKSVTKVQEITITGSEYVGFGKSVTLKAAVYPSTASNKSVTWTSSDKNVATVNSSGVVTAKKLTEPASVEITATAKDGSGISDTFVLTVLPATSSVAIYCEGEKVSGKTLSYQIKRDEFGEDIPQPIELNAVMSPEDCAQNILWTSSNKNVATVSEDGFVIGHKAGTATIKAKAQDGSGKYASVSVKVTVPAAQIEISASKGIAYGKSVTLKAYVYPDDATSKSVTWSSSDPSVIRVSSSGAATALAESGSAVITATAKDGSGVIGSAIINACPAAKSIAIYYTLATSPDIESNGKNIPHAANANGEAIGANGFIENAELAGSRLTVLANEISTICLSAVVSPDGASQDVRFTSSDPSVACVFELTEEQQAEYGYKAYLQIYKRGATVITAKAKDGSSVSKTFTLAVNQLVESISVSGSTYLVSGQSARLTASVYPATATVTSVNFALDDSDHFEDYSAYASVTATGVVTAKTVQKATEIKIRVSAKDTSGVSVVYSMMIYPTESDVPSADATYRALVVVEPTQTSTGKLLNRQSDFDGMTHMLKMQCFGNGGTIDVTGLHKTSASTVLSKIASLASKTSDSDITYFYFLGHGKSDGTIMFYDGSSISAAALRNALDKIHGRVIVFLANCYSGYYVKDPTEANGLKLAAAPNGDTDMIKEESETLIETTSASPAAFCQSVISAFAGKDSTVTLPLMAGKNAVSENIGELRTTKFYVLTASLYNESSWFNYYFGEDGEINESVSFDRFTRGLYRAGGWDQIYGSNTWSGSDTLTLAQVYSKVSSYVKSFTDFQSSVQVYPSGSSMVIFSH